MVRKRSRPLLELTNLTASTVARNRLFQANVDADLKSFDDVRLESFHLGGVEDLRLVNRRVSIMDQFSNVVVDEHVHVTTTYQTRVEQ